MPVTRGVVDDGKSGALGKYSYRVDMWYLGTFIGSALVESVHSARTARAMALNGIQCSVYPMSDLDRIVFTREQHRRR